MPDEPTEHHPGPPPAPVRSGYVTFHGDLAGLLAPITEVTQHPDNYNNGDVDKIIESIEVNGMYRPVYAQRSTGYIVGGNHTYAACLALEATEIPIVWLDIDDATADRILGADNWIAALAQPDPALELALLERIYETDNLLGTGRTEADLEAMRALAEIPADADDFAQWPLVSVRVPPHVKNAYMRMTAHAVGDRERFELMLRLAGWDGRKG
jgi:ParB-like nuclease family protein